MSNNKEFAHARNIRVANRLVDSVLETVKTLHRMGVTEKNAWNAVEELVDLSIDDCVAMNLGDDVMNASVAVSQLMDDLWG